MTKDKITQVKFDERNVPISHQFDDPYFNFQDGLAESEFVFLQGNQLPARFQNGFSIAELGFGTGLNALLTWHAWRQSGLTGEIHMTSFEAFPISSSDQAKALSFFPQLAKLSAIFLDQFDGHNFSQDGFNLTVINQDARKALPKWGGQADAWYLDGFSPAKNPELWGADLMQSVYDHTSTHGTFATYTAAGFVRKNLTNAGFQVERVKGFGHKRHMTIGHKP